MKIASAPIAATKNAPTTIIKRVTSKVDCNLKNCEATLNIGLFFDGTNNNKDRDSAKRSDTNIARLFDLYSDVKTDGHKKVYIPGVGTKFPEIGEYGESKAGLGCAFGCEGRVIFALLAIFNTLHQYCSKNNMFDKGSILALCRNNASVPDDHDCENLAKLGIRHGLLQPEIGSSNNRREFLTRQSNYLTAKINDGKPRIVECFVDVFGFSRGAAEARVFCHWLDELLVDGRLAGVPLHFRFVGIIDTVASAGFWAGTKSFLTNSTGGHGAWASAESLSLPVSVQNCVHMVAMHELRRNFPLDQIGIDGKLQAGWVQLAYPGAHSDVGGGYQPGELGISVEDDSKKLSQIPLNHMLDCAIAAGAPMKKPTRIPGSYNSFAIHSDLTKAYDDFVSQASLTPRPIHEWLQPYLNWRWQIRAQFHTTNQVRRANQADKDILIAFNKILIDDASAIAPIATRSSGQLAFEIVKTVFSGSEKRKVRVRSKLDPEAQTVLALAQRAAPTPPAFAALFDNYVHDSLAGFNSPNLELTGYWRYRKVFLGSDEHTIAANQDTETVHNMA